MYVGHGHRRYGSDYREVLRFRSSGKGLAMGARRVLVAFTSVMVALGALVVLAPPPAGAAPGQVYLGAPEGRDVWPNRKRSALNVDNPGTETDAIVRFRNSRGVLVRTFSTPPECFFDSCTLAESSDGHNVDWDGKNNAGVNVAPGRYTGTIHMVDSGGQPHDVSLGNVWVNRLVTRTEPVGFQETWKDPEAAPYGVVGRCSQVLGPTSGTPWLIRLLSMNKCDSAEGTDDWAFHAQKLALAWDNHTSRILSVRVGAKGSPPRAGETGSIVVDASAGGSAEPQWRRVVELGKAGTHVSAPITVPRGRLNKPPFELLVQGRVVNGNRWRIEYFVAGWTYRAFTR